MLPALLWAACSAYDAALLDAPSLRENRSTCAERQEQCNGQDDDCDGIIDEQASQACTLPHARARCQAGMCVVDGCDDGFLSCDGESDNGCEHDVAACGGCEKTCSTDRPSGAGQAAPAPSTGRLATGELDAGGPDGDAGACGPERCNGADDDCDGRVDEQDVCCLSAAPTGQGADCDRCACERCSGALGHCTGADDADYRASCGALMRCFGANSVAGRCSPDDPDCATACGVQWLAAGWRPNKGCDPDELSTACSAFVLVRQTCYQTKCDKVCKH